LKERLDKALHNALDDDEYSRWAQPVLENGRLTMEQKLDIDKEKGNEKDALKDINNLATAEDVASVQERHRLLSDSTYRQQVLGHLPTDQRELAENVLKQGDLDQALKQINKLVAAQDPASLDERNKLLSDKDYRQQVLAQFPEGERRLAENILLRGQPLP